MGAPLSPLSHIPIRTISHKDAEHDSRVLRSQAPSRVRAVVDALTELEQLALYNPTKTQQDAIIKEIDAAVARLRARYDGVAALQVSLGLEDLR